MKLAYLRRIAATCSATVAAACGTEGGNPHRNDPAPSRGEKTADETPPATNSPISREDAKSPGLEKDATCDFTADAAQTSEGGKFIFAFAAANSAATQSTSGQPLVAAASLTRSVADPAGGPDKQETKPISEWQPAPGNWLLIVKLSDPSGIDPEKTYCTGTLTLGDGVTESTSLTITVSGIRSTSPQ